MFSAFDGFMGKEKNAKIWMFLNVSFIVVQKSVSQLDEGKNILYLIINPEG